VIHCLTTATRHAKVPFQRCALRHLTHMAPMWVWTSYDSRSDLLYATICRLFP